MNIEAKKVILHSRNGYSKKYDGLLNQLIEEKVLLFCAVGKDCELWHDIMDELFVGNGDERDFLMITTWHSDEDIDEVIDFAESFDIEGIDNEKVQVIEI